MKKQWRTILFCAAASMLATGCGESKQEAMAETTPTAVPTEAQEAEATKAPVEPTKAVAEDEPSPTAEEDPEENDPADKMPGREECYEEILGSVKAMMDGQCTREELEAASIYSDLWDYGWTTAEGEAPVRYLYYDVDGDGTEELIITYRDGIVDIYGFDGKRAKKAIWTDANCTLRIHPAGMLQRTYEDKTTGQSGEIWYQFDATFGDYFSVFEKRYEEAYGDQYYTFCYYGLDGEDYEEVVRAYGETGYYPVWIGEWSDELKKDEYEKIVPKTEPVKLPEGEDFSGVPIPEA